jgi:cytochrome c-type biogenesis protein CcmE
MNNKKFIIGGVIIGLAIVVLAVMGFQGGSGYYFTVVEALEKRADLDQSSLRIQGEVAPGFQVSSLSQNVLFTLLYVNEEGETEPEAGSIEVNYTGALPNNFEAGRHVVVEGHFENDGSFKASQIITACASKYEPAYP